MYALYLHYITNIGYMINPPKHQYVINSINFLTFYHYQHLPNACKLNHIFTLKNTKVFFYEGYIFFGLIILKTIKYHNAQPF